MKKLSTGLFYFFVFLILLTPFMVFRDLLFPYVTSKAFYFRILVELALPFYVYLILSTPSWRPKLKNPLTISVLAFLLFNLLAAFFGVNTLKSIWGNFERMGGVFYLAHLVLLYFYVLLIGQMNIRAFRVFLQAVVGVGVLVALDGLMILLTHNHFGISDPSYPRVSGTFGNPIYIASFLVLPMFISCFLAWQEEVNWKKAGYFLAALLQLIIVFTSGTRGAIVGIGIGLFLASLLYVILTPSRKLKVWGGAGVVALVILAGLLFTLHNKFPQGSMLRRVSELQDSNSTARIIQWGVALKGYTHYPIFGVGPENYYFLSNQYYNPAIYKYDASWFDKPHNYLIEVLVTSGIFGILSYLAVLALSVWALWRAYKKDIILLGEFCLLACGLVAYEIQNLFVFDTVASSIMFFAFVGFCAYLWYESGREEKTQQKKDKKVALSPAFCYTAFVVVLIGSIYMIAVANAQPMEVGKAINYGYAYAGVDPQMGENYFQRATTLPFNFDPIQTANKYSDFAVGLALNPGTQTSDFVSQVLQNSLKYQEAAVAEVPNDPTAFQEMANGYLTQSILSKQPLNQRAVDVVSQAISLAPSRPEPLLIKARIQIYQNDNNGAINTLQDLIRELPQYNDARIQLALLYYYQGNLNQAILLGQQLVDAGYTPQQPAQLAWLGAAYEKNNQLSKAVAVYKYIINKMNPNDPATLWVLAQDYAKLGDKIDALAIAQKLIQLDSKDAAQFQSFINSLK